MMMLYMVYRWFSRTRSITVYEVNKRKRKDDKDAAEGGVGVYSSSELKRVIVFF